MYCVKGVNGAGGEKERRSEKQLGGIPTSRSRMHLRKQCKPQGPIGYMIETLHVNASKIDQEGRVHQQNQLQINSTITSSANPCCPFASSLMTTTAFIDGLSSGIKI